MAITGQNEYLSLKLSFITIFSLEFKFKKKILHYNLV
jgi:hypothetical protein